MTVTLAIGIGVLVTLLVAVAGESEPILTFGNDIGFWTLWLLFLVTGNVLSALESERISSYVLNRGMVLLSLIAFFASACGVAFALWLATTTTEYRILASVTGMSIGVVVGGIIGTTIGLWTLFQGRFASRLVVKVAYGIIVGTVMGMIIAILIVTIKVTILTDLTFAGMDILKGIASSGAAGIIMALVAGNDFVPSSVKNV